jgi:uncharacterized protein YvpB
MSENNNAKNKIKFLLLCSLGSFAMLGCCALLFLNFANKSAKQTDGIISGFIQENSTETSIAVTDESTSQSETPAKTAKDIAQYNINVESILQEPELPSGCEVTSLAMVLNFYGIQADKCDLADHYLECLPIKQANTQKCFAGDPYDDYAYGCFSNVLSSTANKYLEATKSLYPQIQLHVTNTSGQSFDSLLNYVCQGKPVIIWGTEKMQPAGDEVLWEVDGETSRWRYGQHCLVLIGYDTDNQTVKIADPLEGICDYDMEASREAYGAMYSQSILITP